MLQVCYHFSSRLVVIFTGISPYLSRDVIWPLSRLIVTKHSEQSNVKTKPSCYFSAAPLGCYWIFDMIPISSIKELYPSDRREAGSPWLGFASLTFQSVESESKLSWKYRERTWEPSLLTERDCWLWSEPGLTWAGPGLINDGPSRYGDPALCLSLRAL